MVLAMLTYAILSNGSGWFTPADFAFLMLLAGLPFARWLDYHLGGPLTSTGEPATPADLRRYVVGTVLLGVCVWVTANVLGNYWLDL